MCVAFGDKNSKRPPLMSDVSCLLSPVSCLLSPVSCLLSLVSCLLSLVSCLSSLPSRQTNDRLGEFVNIDRLRNVHLESGGERLFAVFCSGQCGERDRGNFRSLLGLHRAELSDQRIAILARHVDVRKQKVR